MNTKDFSPVLKKAFIALLPKKTKDWVRYSTPDLSLISGQCCHFEHVAGCAEWSSTARGISCEYPPAASLSGYARAA